MKIVGALILLCTTGIGYAAAYGGSATQPGAIRQIVNRAPNGVGFRPVSNVNNLKVGTRVIVNGANGISTRIGTVQSRPYGGNTIQSR